MIKKSIHSIALYFVLASCVNNTDFDIPKSTCEDNLIPNTTFTEVKNMYVDGILQIQEDLVMEGYVVSSDRAGNFFGVLYIQNSPENPSEGFQIAVDIRDSHLFYPVGSKIGIKLKGLFLDQNKGVFKLGGVFSAFGNRSIGRLPMTAVQQHISLSCDVPTTIQPAEHTIDAIDDDMLNTLVKIDALEVVEEELGLPYAQPKEETERTMMDCNGNEIILLNSGYSDFQAEILPKGNGPIIAVLTKEKNSYKIIVRDTTDIDFSNDRCPPDMLTSNKLFISELADPDNNAGARFVELYNADTDELTLKGWTLRRYTNANTDIGSSIDLSGFSIAAESTFVISPNATEFKTVYGFAPDMEVSTNSPADSNGDDNLELMDPFGAVIDVFGIVGEDGSGTQHEFEDGRAVRNDSIVKGNPRYTFSEWTLFNDTGDSGTIKMPQNAPGDFTPSDRN